MPQNSWVDFGKKKTKWSDLWGPSTTGPSMGNVGLGNIPGVNIPNGGAGGSKVYGGGYGQNRSDPMRLGYGNTLGDAGPQKETQKPDPWAYIYGMLNPGQPIPPRPTYNPSVPTPEMEARMARFGLGGGWPSGPMNFGYENTSGGNQLFGEGLNDEPPPGDKKEKHDPIEDVIGPPNKGPGASTPWEQFQWWKPQGGKLAGYNPNWSMPIPSGNGSEESEAQVETAHFFNWFNKVLPYLDPKSLAAIIPQLNNAAADLPPDQGRLANEYLNGLSNTVAQMNKWGVDAGTYWDRDKLREVQQLTNNYFSGVAGVNDKGEPTAGTEYEPAGQKLIRLLGTILGNPAANTQGVWNVDQPMNRRARYAYGDVMNSQLTGDSLFNTVMRAILNPVTSAPTLSSSAIGYMPQQSGYLYSPRVQNQYY